MTLQEQLLNLDDVTLRELAEEAGVSHSTLSRIRAGKAPHYRASTERAVAEALARKTSPKPAQGEVAHV